METASAGEAKARALVEEARAAVEAEKALVVVWQGEKEAEWQGEKILEGQEWVLALPRVSLLWTLIGFSTCFSFAR